METPDTAAILEPATNGNPGIMSDDAIIAAIEQQRVVLEARAEKLRAELAKIVPELKRYEKAIDRDPWRVARAPPRPVEGAEGQRQGENQRRGGHPHVGGDPGTPRRQRRIYPGPGSTRSPARSRAHRASRSRCCDRRAGFASPANRPISSITG